MTDLRDFYLASISREDGVTPITFIRQLGVDEANELSTSMATLLKFSAEQNLYILTELNVKEFERALAHYRENFHEYAGRYESMEGMMTNITRVILNYLASFRTFLDYAETALKRECGKNSLEVDAFKKATNQEYDTVFAYRFLSKFRNFAQHVATPVDSMSQSASIDDGETPLQVFVSKARLLDESELFGKAVCSEINSLPDKIPIAPYLNDLRPCIERLRRARYKHKAEAIKTSATCVQAKVSEVAASSPNVMPVFARLEPGSTPQRPIITLVNIPLHTIRAALTV